jgi:hypothetical protein
VNHWVIATQTKVNRLLSCCCHYVYRVFHHLNTFDRCRIYDDQNGSGEVLGLATIISKTGQHDWYCQQLPSTNVCIVICPLSGCQSVIIQPRILPFACIVNNRRNQITFLHIIRPVVTYARGVKNTHTLRNYSI